MGLFDVFTGQNQADAAKKAAGQQVTGLQNANNLLGDARGQIGGALAPYIQSGLKGMGVYEDALGLNGQARAQGVQQNFQQSPGYQFQQQEMQRAVQNAAGAQGGLLSGAALMELQQRGGQLANQEFGGYLDRLGGLSDSGRQTAVQGQQLQVPLWMQGGQNLADIGTARATGTVGAANAKQNAFSDILGFAGKLIGFG